MNTPTKYKTPYEINLNTSEFKEVVNYIIDNYEIDEIVETGTFNGLGSTSTFARTGKYVFTIECNYYNFTNAIRNLASFENVCVIHGLSVTRKDLMMFLLHEKFDSDTTYDSKHPKSFYMREIVHSVVVENALNLFSNNDRKQLVFLDSAGGVGFFEFCKFMSYPKEYLKNKILMLDDISHIKHERSVKRLIEEGYEVNISKEKRFAWCDLSKQNIVENL